MESRNIDRYVFRLFEELYEAGYEPSMHVEVRHRADRWPDAVKAFLEGLRAAGYVIDKEGLQKAFDEILEEWV